MADKGTPMDVDSVSDPSDFPPSSVAPGLREMDDALRCGVCRDLYEAPVTLTCGHCFCSMCIRTHLPLKGECPSCRQTASESHIRKNIAMENALIAWRVARPYILQLYENVEEHEQRTSSPDVEEIAGLRRPIKKRKRRSSKEEFSDSDIEIISTPSNCVARRSAQGPSASLYEAHSPQTNLVECPICQKKVPESLINDHIDSNCQKLQAAEKGKQKQAWSRLLNAPGVGSSHSKHKTTGKGKGKARAQSQSNESDTPQYIPKLAYDTLKDKVIKERLQEFGLSAAGNRAIRIERHKRWIAMYNANQDRSLSIRKTDEELKRELQQWEEDQRTTKQEIVDVAAYQKDNMAAFAKLIDVARPKKVPVNDGGTMSRSRDRSQAERGDGSNPEDVSSHREVDDTISSERESAAS